MKKRYDKITHEDFHRILEGYVNAETGAQLLLIPGVYECCAEHFNNEVLDAWYDENIEKAKIRIQKKKADRFLYTGR